VIIFFHYFFAVSLFVFLFTDDILIILVFQLRICVVIDCLDGFCMNQDVKYDFMAALTGTGDRSVNKITET